MPAGNFIAGDRNVQTHGWYQKRHHVPLPAWAQNAEYFDRDAPFALGTTGVNVGANTYICSPLTGASIATESPLGTITLNCDGTNPATADKQITVKPGEPYRIAATITSPTAIVRIGTTQGGTDVLASQTMTANQASSYDFVAPAGGVIWVQFRRQSAGAPVVSAISVAAL